MVVSELIGLVAGDNARLAVGIALLAVALYYRKALGLGSLLQTWAGRAATSAVVLGILLVLGIIPGINVEAAIGYADQLAGVAGDLVPQLREVLAA
jgi:hypothetical protein